MIQHHGDRCCWRVLIALQPCPARTFEDADAVLRWRGQKRDAELRAVGESRAVRPSALDKQGRQREWRRHAWRRGGGR